MNEMMEVVFGRCDLLGTAHSRVVGTCTETSRDFLD